MGKSFRASQHMLQRCQQRGYRDDDIPLLLEVGVNTRDGVLLRNKDAARGIQQRKKEIQQLERLAGTLVILDAHGLTGKTAYRAGKKKIRHQTYR